MPHGELTYKALSVPSPPAYVLRERWGAAPVFPFDSIHIAVPGDSEQSPRNPISENGKGFRWPWEAVEGVRPQNSSGVFSPEASSPHYFECFPSRSCWNFQTLTFLAPLICLVSEASSAFLLHVGPWSPYVFHNLAF